MSNESDNCIICALEFPADELRSVALSAINITKLKICENCLNDSDPAYDYREVRQIVNRYLNFGNK